MSGLKAQIYVFVSTSCKSEENMMNFSASNIEMMTVIDTTAAAAMKIIEQRSKKIDFGFNDMLQHKFDFV